ncbi:uncharacterized protein ACBT57_024758 [Dama dama]|uniref:uncharacterized protein LOC133073026 n=1 Tax=Dama dama TaxID=30532 RepID=UPI002A35F7E9|nr:uncharacterized protein LOC133073026 [Dama dama]
MVSGGTEVPAGAGRARAPSAKSPTLLCLPLAPFSLTCCDLGAARPGLKSALAAFSTPTAPYFLPPSLARFPHASLPRARAPSRSASLPSGRARPAGGGHRRGRSPGPDSAARGQREPPAGAAGSAPGRLLRAGLRRTRGTPRPTLPSRLPPPFSRDPSRVRVAFARCILKGERKSVPPVIKRQPQRAGRFRDSGSCVHLSASLASQREEPSLLVSGLESKQKTPTLEASEMAVSQSCFSRGPCKLSTAHRGQAEGDPGGAASSSHSPANTVLSPNQSRSSTLFAPGLRGTPPVSCQMTCMPSALLGNRNLEPFCTCRVLGTVGTQRLTAPWRAAKPRGTPSPTLQAAGQLRARRQPRCDYTAMFFKAQFGHDSNCLQEFFSLTPIE